MVKRREKKLLTKHGTNNIKELVKLWAAEGIDMLLQDLQEMFTYHPPTDGQVEKYVQIREKAKELAILIHGVTPPSREQSLAITHLQTCVMFANAAIAIHGRNSNSISH